jgi:hypothetical protein
MANVEVTPNQQQTIHHHHHLVSKSLYSVMHCSWLWIQVSYYNKHHLINYVHFINSRMALNRMLTQYLSIIFEVPYIYKTTNHIKLCGRNIWCMGLPSVQFRLVGRVLRTWTPQNMPTKHTIHILLCTWPFCKRC